MKAIAQDCFTEVLYKSAVWLTVPQCYLT